MGRTLSEKERQFRTIRQYKRITTFIKNQFDNFSEVNADFPKLAKDENLKKSMEYLNQFLKKQVLISNSRLYKFLVEKKILSKEAQTNLFSNEIIAIFFTTNPLLIFNLLSTFLDYREKKVGREQDLVTHEISLLLYTFNKFILNLDQFEKVVKLTLLRSDRFAPYRHHFLHTIQMICQYTKDSMLNSSEPLFTKDLRRLYIIISRALYISSIEAEQPNLDVIIALMELTSILDLSEGKLKEDEQYAEFEQFHFTLPELEQLFFKRYELLKKIAPQFTFEFLGLIHREDRNIIIKALYKRSKSEVLGLFLQLRSYYRKTGSEFPSHYEKIINSIFEIIKNEFLTDSYIENTLLEIAETIKEVVVYEEIKNDSSVDQSLVDELFTHGVLYMEDFAPDESISDQEFQELKRISERDLEIVKIIGRDIFEAFNKNGDKARESKYLLELATLPFCYLTIEFGKKYLNLITIGEVILMGLNEGVMFDLLYYFKKTDQLTDNQLGIIKQELPALTILMRKIAPQKIILENIKMYDRNYQLKLYKFKLMNENIRTSMKIRFPRYLERFKYTEFLLEVLKEMERWLSRETDILISELPDDAVVSLLRNGKRSAFFDNLMSHQTGKIYEEELKKALVKPEIFYEQLIIEHKIKLKVLEYERTLNKKAKERLSTMNYGKLALDSIKDSSDYILAPFLIRTKLFNSLNINPKLNSQYLWELARFPFRFMINENGKNKMKLFNLAEVICMGLQPKERMFLFHFLHVTGQVNDFELSVIKNQVVALMMLLEPLLEKFDHSECKYKVKTRKNKIDFNEFYLKLKIAEELFEEHLPMLLMIKELMLFYIAGTEQIEQWVLAKMGEDFSHLTAEQIISFLKKQGEKEELVEALKNSKFGEQYADTWELSERTVNSVVQKLIEGYQVNMILLDYFQQNH